MHHQIASLMLFYFFSDGEHAGLQTPVKNKKGEQNNTILMTPFFRGKILLEA